MDGSSPGVSCPYPRRVAGGQPDLTPAINRLDTADRHLGGLTHGIWSCLSARWCSWISASGIRTGLPRGCDNQTPPRLVSDPYPIAGSMLNRQWEDTWHMLSWDFPWETEIAGHLRYPPLRLSVTLSNYPLSTNWWLLLFDCAANSSNNKDLKIMFSISMIGQLGK